MTEIPEAQSAEDVIATITPIFREVMEDDDLDVHRELDANQVEAWDSLSHITLIVELENLYDVQFTTDDLASMATVGDLVDGLIARRQPGSDA